MALKGCCCCRLREGTLAIGITFLVLTILGLLFSIPKWAQMGEAEAKLKRLRSSGSSLEISTDSYDGSRNTVTASEEAIEQLLVITKVSLAVRLVDVVLSVLFNSLLIHGVRRSRPGMLVGWMVYYGIVFTVGVLAGLALLIGGIVIAAVSSSSDAPEVMGIELVPAIGAVVIVGGLIVLGLVAFFWYLWAAVFTYHRELREQSGAYKREMPMEESPPPYTPAK